MMRMPVSTLPVKLTSPTSLCDDSVAPVWRPPLTRLKTPAGRSVSATSSAKSKALSGVSSLGLTTMVLPVTSAGAILRAIRKNGKFQGRMPAVTPMALRNRKMCSPARSLGTISPSMRRAHSAM